MVGTCLATLSSLLQVLLRFFSITLTTITLVSSDLDKPEKCLFLNFVSIDLNFSTFC